MSGETCSECGGQLIEHEGAMKCPFCDSITVYTEDNRSSESSSVSTDSDTEDK